MLIRSPGAKRSIVSIATERLIHFADEPVMGTEFFLYAVRHVLWADLVGFKGDNRMTNVPIVDLGNTYCIIFCRPANLHSCRLYTAEEHKDTRHTTQKTA